MSTDLLDNATTATAPTSADAPKVTTVGGAKVTINPTPDNSASERIRQNADREVRVTDDRGREILLQKPGIMAQFDLIEALGETAKNEVYMGMVLPMLFIRSIDGAPVPTPSSKNELRALIQRLGEDGLNAVMAGVAENFAPAQGGEDAQKNG